MGAVGGHDRRPAGQSLNDDRRHALDAGGERKDVGLRHVGERVGGEAGKGHDAAQAELADQLLEPRALGAFAQHDQPRAPPARKARERMDERREVLALDQAADAQDDRRLLAIQPRVARGLGRALGQPSLHDGVVEHRHPRERQA